MKRKVDTQQLRRYKDGGWQMIPLHEWDYVRNGKPKGKAPRDSNWTLRQYENAELKKAIEDGLNIGIRMGENDLIIDYDPKHEPAGRNVRLELELEYGIDLSIFPCVRTGSGGAHYYTKLASPVRTFNGLEAFPGIEFKGYGKQVVAAGSIHPGDPKTGLAPGNLYVWANDVPIASPPEFPAALLAALVKPIHPEASSATGQITAAWLKECLDQLDPVNFRSHDLWLELLMASHSATGGGSDGCEEFVAWSTTDPQFADAGALIRERWTSFDACAPGGVTIGTLYMHVLDAGGRLPRRTAQEEFDPIVTAGDSLKIPPMERVNGGKPKPTIGNAEAALIAFGLEFRYNQLDGNIKIGGNLKWLRAMYPSADTVFTDLSISMIQGLCMRQFGLELTPDKIDQAVTGLAHLDSFNPIKEYLGSLLWDGTPRLDTWLVDYAGVEDNPYTRAVGRLTLTAAVARVFVPGVKFDTMTVLEGPQGGFKSTLIAVMGGEFTQAGLPNKDPNDKDVVSALRGKWVIEVEELSALKRADVESFKAFLSRTSDRARLAYDRKSRDFPRQCIFIGTTNGSDYLRDSTGNRRFLPVRVGKIKPDALAADRDQLWAEALGAWEARPTAKALELPESLWSFAGQEQELRRAVDPLEEAVGEYLEKLSENWVSSRTLAWECMKLHGNEFNVEGAKRLCAAVGKHGWVAATSRVNGPPQRGYRRPDWREGKS